MNDTNENYSNFITLFTQWANEKPDIRAARIVGSRGKEDQSMVNEWSDLDIEFYTTKPFFYRQNMTWVNEITPLWMGGYDDDGNSLGKWWSRFQSWTLFATVEHGLAIDFIIVPNLALIMLDWRSRLRTRLRSHLRGQSTPHIAAKSILLDKDGRLKRSGGIGGHPPVCVYEPTTNEYTFTVKEFWGIVDRLVRKMGTGDLYEVKHLLDIGLKRQLLKMTEWHTGLQKGWGTETGFRGRHIDKWADPRIVEALSDAYAHYNLADMKRALLVTIELFRWVAIDVAEGLNLQYEHRIDKLVTEWMNEQLPRI